MKFRINLPQISIPERPKKVKIKRITPIGKIKVKDIYRIKPRRPRIRLPRFQSSAIAGVAVSTIVFLIILTLFGSISSNLNTSMMSTSTMNLINLIPLILVGACIIGIVVTAFKLSDI